MSPVFGELHIYLMTAASVFSKSRRVSPFLPILPNAMKPYRMNPGRVLPSRPLYRRKLIGLVAIVALMSAAPALAQSPIVIREDEDRPLVGSLREVESYFSDLTSIGQPEHQNLQALADQSGANQVWDLTGYTYDPAPRTFANYFWEFDPLDPNDPGASIPAYQGANCVAEAPQSLNPDLPGDNWAYFFIGDNKLEDFGNLIVGGPRIEQAPPALSRDYPVEFGKTWTTTFTRTIVGAPGGAVSVTITRDVDGWGTLMIPGAQAPALRILRTTTIGGLTEPSIEFVTEAGISASLGFDVGLQVWESVVYDLETITGGGPEFCGTDPGPQGGILFVVDDAASLSNADALARDLMASLNLDIEIVSDDLVTTADGMDRDLIVVSGSADAAVVAADWAATEVPLISWEEGLYGALRMTGLMPDVDYGVTAATNVLILADATHPIANGASGDVEVSTSASPMNFGLPSNTARVVAQADGGKATIFTYDTDAMLVDGSNAPARRVGFFMGADGPAEATVDGMILLENALLWALGRAPSQSVAVETLGSEVPDAVYLDQNYPNPFNPTTVIPFSVASTGPVALSVYNVLGQTVATLVDEHLPAGRYTADFRGDGLPSGVYLYRLEAGATVVIRKMMLAK